MHPSRHLSLITEKKLNLKIPDKVPAGSSFILDGYDFKDVNIQGEKLTPLSNNKYFLGLGLYQSSPARAVRQNIKKRIFNHDLHQWDINNIDLNRPELKKGNQLKISKKVWKKVSSDKKLRDQQRKKARAAVKEKNGPAELNCWQAPLKSKIVSRFGSPRYLPNGVGYYHSGVDLRGWTGTPIKSPAIGKVVMAEHMIVPGNNIILSHGGQIYSRYMHLSKMKVSVGQTVQKGQVLGLSGSTGRVEGAHLHWEVLWKGQRLDPHLFIETWNSVCSRQ